MKKNTIFLLLAICLLVLAGGELMAQCPMCKMAAESNLKQGGTAGKGLNKGILFLLAMPYALVAVLGLLWWRNNKRQALNI
jgi:hypothetical protein